jgi:hypothetical protein
MTVAADVLALYAREWHIDSTPMLRDLYVSSGRSAEWDPDFESLSSGPRVVSRYMPTLPMFGSWILASAVASADPRVAGSTLFECVHMRTACLAWTTAALEVERWTGARLRQIGGVLDPGLAPSVADAEGADAGEDADAAKAIGRAQRAVNAVRDLAGWLGTTEPEAADLAGNYRRSYYNWLKGTQPYPATTLNLFEAHALVASLVDAFGGKRGARMWLDARDSAGDNWRSLLSTREGRADLTRAAAGVLFRPIDRPAWSPDDDLAHDVGSSLRRQPDNSHRPSSVVPRPSGNEPSPDEPHG